MSSYRLCENFRILWNVRGRVRRILPQCRQTLQTPARPVMLLEGAGGLASTVKVSITDRLLCFFLLLIDTQYRYFAQLTYAKHGNKARFGLQSNVAAE